MSRDVLVAEWSDDAAMDSYVLTSEGEGDELFEALSLLCSHLCVVWGERTD